MNRYTRRLLCLFMLCLCCPAFAEETVWDQARWATTASFGNSYSPGNELRFGQLGLSAQWDYDQIWAHRAPENLKFKVEGSAGFASTPHTRAIISANILAVYPFDSLTCCGLRPFIEAGIGLIYTDYQVKDQGLRINFNPLLGFGGEFASLNGQRWFVTARLHHISNGELHRDNQGINSAVLQIGRHF
nr:acyloxyacyl hydrolase [uncultured Desulfuromonas sp.]